MSSLLLSSVIYTALLLCDVNGRTKPKVIYNNDQGYKYPKGGCDGDNPQGLVHFLFYANEIDIEAIIASGSTNCAPSGTNINEAYNILDLYQKDYDILNKSSVNSGGDPYPTYDQLKSVTYQGCNHSAPEVGYPPYSMVASNKIIEIVDGLAQDEHVWYGAGAGLCELARALHDKPSIATQISLYSIGSWNTQQDPYARKYIFDNFPYLFWVESNGTFGGWFNGGDQSGNYSDSTFDTQIISKGGNLGKYYSTIIPSQFSTPNFQEGDGPAYFYTIDPQHANRNLYDPTQPNWGGQYSNPYSNRPEFFSDDWSKYGGTSINQWRKDYLDDWMKRLQWFST